MDDKKFGTVILHFNNSEEVSLMPRANGGSGGAGGCGGSGGCGGGGGCNGGSGGSGGSGGVHISTSPLHIQSSK